MPPIHRITVFINGPLASSYAIPRPSRRNLQAILARELELAGQARQVSIPKAVWKQVKAEHVTRLQWVSGNVKIVFEPY
jgi:hypothetical protein